MYCRSGTNLEDFFDIGIGVTQRIGEEAMMRVKVVWLRGLV